MKTIANFAYAGTSKYVSHAVEGVSTLCGMSVDELLERTGQEWDIIEDEKYMGRVTVESRKVGCSKCLRVIAKRKH